MLEKKIRGVHSDWLRYCNRYLMGEDFMRGGFEVKYPRLFRQTHRYRNRVKTTDAVSDVKYNQSFAEASSYLFPHDRESKHVFDARNDRARHFPVMKPIFEIIYDGLVKNPVKRGGEVDHEKLSSDFWKSFLKDCTGTGEDFDTYKRDVVLMGMSCGKSGTLIHVDRHRPQPASEAHRRANQSLPYLQYFSAYNILDWDYDRHGNLVSVLLNEPLNRVSVDDRYKRKLVNRRAVVTYIGDSYGQERVVPDETYTHDLGVVPFVVFRLNRLCDPYASDLIDIDRGIYNDCSLLNEIDRNQTFSILAFPSNGGLVEGLDIGLHSAISYNSDSGSPMYLSPDAQIAAGLWVRIKEQFQLARTVGSVSRGMAEVSKEARSSSAMKFESDEKYNKMIALALGTERWENELFRIISLATGEPELLSSVSKEFDVLALENKIDTVLKLKESDVKQQALVPIFKTVMQDLMKRVGVPGDEIEKAVSILDSGISNTSEPSEELPGLRQQQKELDV